MINLSTNGYSLLELIIVIAIITAVSMFAIPAAEITQVRLREKELKQRLTEIRQGIDKYSASCNGSSGSFYPPSIASLTEQIPDSLLKPGADSGPFITSEATGNPFSPDQSSFIWDIRDSNGTWHTSQTDPNASLNCYDIRYPSSGVAGWVKGINETFYEQW